MNISMTISTHQDRQWLPAWLGKTAAAATTVVAASTAMVPSFAMDAFIPSVAPTAAAWHGLSQKAAVNSETAWHERGTLEHPTMKAEAVQQFQTMMPEADLPALRAIFDLMHAQFSDVQKLSWAYQATVDSDTLAPELFLQFDTHGMDIDEQLERELKARDAMMHSPRLLLAKHYHVVTVV